MTPMVDAGKVEGLVGNPRRYVSHLRQLSDFSEREFVSDPIKVGAAKYYLQVAIECCIDLANHIIATERLRIPQDYRDSFKVLNEAGILPNDFTATMQEMASFRNRLVHLYWEVDDHRTYRVLALELSDFETFVRFIMTFLGDAPGYQS